MIIHSVTPHEQLIHKTQQQQKEYIPYRSGYLEGENQIEGFIVSRVISTDPKDFLNISITPGKMLKK